MPFKAYLAQITAALKLGDATEHTHRPALKTLIESLETGIVATNEPKRIKCGAPDYIVLHKSVPLGYVEAKDVGVSLDEAAKSEQVKKRYLPALPNLLLTDYLEFRWFVDGKKRETFRLANVAPSGKLAPVAADELDRARHLLLGFLSRKPVDIASAEQLARGLANLAHIIRDIIIRAFLSGQASQQLRDWRDAFAATLLPELAPQSNPENEAHAASEFADMFAQTLAYGLFSARAASGGSKFTREKAQKLIPRANPFLRVFFERLPARNWMRNRSPGSLKI